MNYQIIGVPQDFDLEEKIAKLLNTYQQNQSSNPRLKRRPAQAGFVEITDRESSLRAELNDDPSKSFLYLEIPGLRTAKGRLQTRFYQEMIPGAPYDMQLGRILACHILNEREKVDWKSCVLEKNKE